MDGPPIVATAQLRPDPYSPLSWSIGIVDANVILSSVDNDCRYGRNSRLLRGTLFGCTTLHAADHVYRADRGRPRRSMAGSNTSAAQPSASAT